MDIEIYLAVKCHVYTNESVHFSPKENKEEYPLDDKNFININTLNLTSGQLGSVTSIGFPESHPSLMCLFKGMSPVT